VAAAVVAAATATVVLYSFFALLPFLCSFRCRVNFTHTEQYNQRSSLPPTPGLSPTVWRDGVLMPKPCRGDVNKGSWSTYFKLHFFHLLLNSFCIPISYSHSTTFYAIPRDLNYQHQHQDGY
jgi:hypothetical protein